MNADTHRRWQRLARQRALREVILRRDRPDDRVAVPQQGGRRR